MATPELKLPPIAVGRPRNPLIAALASLVLPGLGHLYVGAMRSALVLVLFNVALPPVLALAWAGGAMDLKTWWWTDRFLGLLLRVVAGALAVVLAFRTRRRPLPVVAPGVYGVIVIGTILLGILVARQLQRWVPPPVELSASAAGLEQGEYVQGRRTGEASSPLPGALALYVVDIPDAAVNPAAPSKRDAFVARVSGVTGAGFTVEGRDAEIPLDDYLGMPVGVVLSRGDGGVRWDRVGFAPR